MLYLESLETRVRSALCASKGHTDLVSIAEAYENDKKINIRLNTTPITSEDFEALISGIERKDVTTVTTPLGEFQVPVPTAQSILKYQKVLKTAAAASIKTLRDLSLLTERNNVDMNQTVARVKQLSKEAVSNCAKTIPRKDFMENILSVMMIERVKDRFLSTICDQYSKPEMWVDPLTQGLWVVNPSDSHPAISAARSRKVTSIYEFDENQTQNLISLAFSTKPREKAAAKLNLFSRVKGTKRDDIKADPRKVLSIVFSESELTQSEIKAMLFYKTKDSQPMCPLCTTFVELDGVTYHQECDVIKWMVENFFFKYDTHLGVLSTQRVVFLDHNQRVMLETIQKYHRTLNSPFKIKGAAKYVVMQKDGDSIKTLTQLQTNPTFVPGTQEWAEKQRRDEANRKRC